MLGIFFGKQTLQFVDNKKIAVLAKNWKFFFKKDLLKVTEQEI